MHILAIGLNHTNTPLQLREKMAFSEDQIRAALSRLSCGGMSETAHEMVILSTCNRVEVYAASKHATFSELEAFLADARGVALKELHSQLYHLSDAGAVTHLMQVAAGLDSQVLGEPQILGQVTRAFELARGVGSSGPLLSRLFQAAIHAGKRARTETSISRNPASASSLAASLCEHEVPDLPQACVIILGAGEMAELSVEALRKRGVANIIVVNRTLERAQSLASRWNAQADTFENLQNLLARADILISSTGAPHTIVSPEMVSDAMQQRPARALVLVDIAVPRDIDPDCGQIAKVSLVDIDHLNAHLEQSLALRAAQVPQVEAILAEEAALFMEYFGSLEMIPLISDMRQQAEAIRQAELIKTLRHLPELTEAERSHIDALTQALVKKLLAHPTNQLRAAATSPSAAELASMTRTLFNLKPNPPERVQPGAAIPGSAAAD